MDGSAKDFLNVLKDKKKKQLNKKKIFKNFRKNRTCRWKKKFN